MSTSAAFREMVQRVELEMVETREGVPTSVVLHRMRAALNRPTRAKVFCAEHVVGPTGHRTANCTNPAGHDGPHVDVHEGRVWGDAR